MRNNASSNKNGDNHIEHDQVEDEESEGIVDDTLNIQLDEALRAELDELIGVTVVGIEVWEESLGDEDEETPVKPEERLFFDCDILLESGAALELYVTTAYPDPEGEPITGMEDIFVAVGGLHDGAMELLDYDDADDEGGLALAFGREEKVHLVLVASAWMVSEWDPAEEEE